MPENVNKVGSILKGKVHRQLTSGLVIKLDDDQFGLVRVREIGWGEDVRRHWRERYKPGDSISTVVLGEDTHSLLELSMRFFERDPWSTLGERHPRGTLIAGKVTGVQNYGVFVEIEPGIEGLLHESRLPVWARKAPTELFWPGDDVRVVIDSIDISQRKIALSMADLRRQRWNQPDGVSTSTVDGTQYRAIHADEFSVISDLAKLPPRRILLVEDDPAQGEAVQNWLRGMGERPTWVDSAEAALAELDNVLPEVLLSDVGLPNMNGIQLATEALTRHPTLNVVLMSGWSQFSEHQQEFEALLQRGVKLTIKPLMQRDLAEALLQASHNRARPPLVEQPSTSGETRSVGQPAEARTSPHAFQAHRQELLCQLTKQTHAGKAVLFEFDRFTRKVEIMDACGDLEINAHAKTNLVSSPVRDVAEDHLRISVDHADLVEGRVRYLKPLLSFQSCIGVPVPYNTSKQYALFIFKPKPHDLSKADEKFVDATAIAVGGLLERNETLAKTTEIQHQALMGNLTRALVHELNHYLSPISLSMDLMRAQKNANEADSPTALKAELQRIRSRLDQVEQSVKELIQTTHLFARFVVPSPEQVYNLHEIIRDAVNLMHDTAERDKVTLCVEEHPTPVLARTHRTHLQQILLNLIVNAVQQIKELRSHEGGQVRLWVDSKSRDSRTYARIHVEDDGPGIHQRLWDQIFEMGYTTRANEGSGLGLYVSQLLANSMGGRLYVAGSRILWGSHFVLELPCESMAEEGQP